MKCKKLRPRRPLRLYQKKALTYINRVKHPALFIDMRLGKTLITIRWIKSHPEIQKILIVSPFSAFYSWKRELRLEGESKPVELIGTWQERSVKLHTSEKWYLINKEGQRVIPEQLSHNCWDVVILDESTFIKDPTTIASKFFVKNFRNVPHRFILTGIPAPESELNYFQQLQFLDPSILDENNYWDFRFKWFHEASHIYTMLKKGKINLSKRLADSCFILSREDAGLKNIKIYEQRMIPLSDKAMNIYTILRDEFLLEVESKVINKTLFAITQFVWMRRLFGGFVKHEPSSFNKLVFDGKYQELKYLLEGELKNERIVIWAVFVDELKFLYKKLSKKYAVQIIHGGIKHADRDKVLKKQNWQILLAQPECFKYGTDLSASDTIIYYSTPLGLESRLQTEDRIITIKKSAVLIIDLVVDCAVEQSILTSLKRKESRQEMIKRLVRRLQNETKKS